MKINNPFVIKDDIGRVKGFNCRRNEGTEFLTNNIGEKLQAGIDEKKTRKIFWTILGTTAVIMVRLFWLQAVQGEMYQQIAAGNRIRLNQIKAERGLIYDRFGQPLVANAPRISLYFIPADLPRDPKERRQAAHLTSQLTGRDETDILNQFDQSSAASLRPELIKGDLSHREAIWREVMSDQMPGIQARTEFRRQYLEHSGLSHVLGYVGRINQNELDRYYDRGYSINDTIGKDGIEFYYENILRGQDGLKEVEVDALGRIKKVLGEKRPIIGDSLILTIDIELQHKLAESLERARKNTGTKAGAAAIAIDPMSGEILALVSLPGFDNNFFSAGIGQEAYNNYLLDPAEPLFNRAISGNYPPGSIFKPIVAAAALEERLIDENKTFLSTGGISIGGWFFPDWKAGGHGRINVIKAIAESVNTFFYYISGGYSNFQGLGPAKITEYAGKFNLGVKSGLDLPGEAVGFLPSREWKERAKNETWYIGDTYHLGIGQGDILVTPLQAAVYTAAIANGGTLRRPHLLKEIGKEKNNGDKANIYGIDDDYIISDGLIGSDNIDIIRRGLRATVLSGSARSLQSLPVTSAGKTGTAQVGGGKNTHAWFTGFAPYEHPTIALTILIENGGGGEVAAVPVFREVIDWYFEDK